MIQFYGHYLIYIVYCIFTSYFDEYMDAKNIGKDRFVVEKSGQMKADVVLYANEHMMERMGQDKTLQQAKNAATLPGLVGNVMVMPDGHEGYGFPIGGVMAFDSENGIISPGSVGFDINCGVRLIKTD